MFDMGEIVAGTINGKLRRGEITIDEAKRLLDEWNKYVDARRAWQHRAEDALLAGLEAAIDEGGEEVTSQYPGDPDARCGACSWWVHDPGSWASIRGHCHRSPPGKYTHPDRIETHPNTELWPVTNASHWCGEFNMRPEVVG